MPTTSPPEVRVQQGKQGEWEVTLPEQRRPLRLETLEDARRVAYLCACHRHPCELIVRDAYHRVLSRELIDEESR